MQPFQQGLLMFIVVVFCCAPMQ